MGTVVLGSTQMLVNTLKYIQLSVVHCQKRMAVEKRLYNVVH